VWVGEKRSCLSRPFYRPRCLANRTPEGAAGSESVPRTAPSPDDYRGDDVLTSFLHGRVLVAYPHSRSFVQIRAITREYTSSRTLLCVRSDRQNTIDY